MAVLYGETGRGWCEIRAQKCGQNLCEFLSTWQFEKIKLKEVFNGFLRQSWFSLYLSSCLNTLIRMEDYTVKLLTETRKQRLDVS